jgi:hypothetical protein
VQLRTINENAIYQRIAPNRIVSLSPTTRTSTGKLELSAYTGSLFSIYTNIVDPSNFNGVRSFSITAANSATAFVLQSGYYVVDGVADAIQVVLTIPITIPTEIKVFWIATWRPNM